MGFENLFCICGTKFTNKKGKKKSGTKVKNRLEVIKTLKISNENFDLSTKRYLCTKCNEQCTVQIAKEKLLKKEKLDKKEKKRKEKKIGKNEKKKRKRKSFNELKSKQKRRTSNEMIKIMETYNVDYPDFILYNLTGGRFSETFKKLNLNDQNKLMNKFKEYNQTKIDKVKVIYVKDKINLSFSKLEFVREYLELKEQIYGKSTLSPVQTELNNLINKRYVIVELNGAYYIKNLDQVFKDLIDSENKKFRDAGKEPPGTQFFILINYFRVLYFKNDRRWAPM